MQLCTLQSYNPATTSQRCISINAYPEPSRSLFNIMIQAQKHYQGFKQIISKEIKQEIAFIHHIIGINSTFTLDLDKMYAQSAGRIFLDSLS